MGGGLRRRSKPACLVIEFQALQAIGIELHPRGNQPARRTKVRPSPFGTSLQVQAAVERLDAEQGLELSEIGLGFVGEIGRTPKIQETPRGDRGQRRHEVQGFNANALRLRRDANLRGVQGDVAQMGGLDRNVQLPLKGLGG